MIANQTTTTITFQAGFTFYFTSGRDVEHAYVVISSTIEQEIAIVNLTTHYECKDSSCTIGRGEHECVTQPTCIFYFMAQRVPTREFQRKLDLGDILPRLPMPADVLKRIQQGAGKSPHSPNWLKKMLSDQRIIAR
jgi:hypothetical protein